MRGVNRAAIPTRRRALVPAALPAERRLRHFRCLAIAIGAPWRAQPARSPRRWRRSGEVDSRFVLSVGTTSILRASSPWTIPLEVLVRRRHTATSLKPRGTRRSATTTTADTRGQVALQPGPSALAHARPPLPGPRRRDRDPGPRPVRPRHTRWSATTKRRSRGWCAAASRARGRTADRLAQGRTGASRADGRSWWAITRSVRAATTATRPTWPPTSSRCSPAHGRPGLPLRHDHVLQHIARAASIIVCSGAGAAAGHVV